MSSSGAPSVDVAIVNWNTPRSAATAAEACLDSQGVDTTVTVVDNASEPERRDELRERMPEGARAVLQERNAGYGSAANAVLRAGRGDFVCVSNADVLPEADALGQLVAAAGEQPGAGMVGPVFRSDTDRYHSRLPGPATLLARVFVGSFNSRHPRLPGPGQIAEMEQPAGAFFVFRRSVWERLGGFDEGFFLWYEDVDLAKRCLDAGYRNLVVGSAHVSHQGAESFQQLDHRELQAIRLPSLERYIRKHYPFLGPVAGPLLRLSAKLRGPGSDRGRRR